jgi:beta-lactamase regulating signal transducer with metallopeptidase domain/multidrug resistance efflux pump
MPQPEALSPTNEATIPSGYSAKRTLLVAWMIGSFSIGLWIVAGWVRLRHLIQHSKESTDSTIQSSCEKISLALNVTRPVRIMISDRTMMPLVIGSRGATLILPSTFSQWESTRQQAVLAHELGHIKRYDCATQLLGQLLCAAYWFHPLSWFISRRLQSEAEAACDDLAIQSGSEPNQYAEHLLDIARSLKGLNILSGTAAQMAGHSRLENRLRLILATGADRNQLSRNCILLCSTLTIISALGFSTIRITANNETDAPPTDTSSSTNQKIEKAFFSPVTLAINSQTNPSKEADSLATETTEGIPADDNRPSQSTPLRLAGTIESANTIYISSKLDKPTAILWRPPYGQRVKKGDLILEFEKGKLVESIESKQIELAQGQAELEAAKSSLNAVLRSQEEIQKTQELSLKLVELKKGKGDADFRLKLKTAESDINLSERRLAEATSNLATTLARVKAGVTGPEDAQSAETRLEDSKAKLEQAKGLYSNLTTYEKAYEQAEHQLTIQQAKSSILNASIQSQNRIVIAEADLQALLMVRDIKRKGLQRLEEALKNSQIYAPLSGRVVPFKFKNSNGQTLTGEKIPKGAIIRNNQPLIAIEDPTGRIIRTFVEEPEINRVSSGQKVTIRVDAYPEATLQGEVTSIDAIQSTRLPQISKVVRFAVHISIKNPPENLQPGLTASIVFIEENGR